MIIIIQLLTLAFVQLLESFPERNSGARKTLTQPERLVLLLQPWMRKENLSILIFPVRNLYSLQRSPCLFHRQNTSLKHHGIWTPEPRPSAISDGQKAMTVLPKVSTNGTTEALQPAPLPKSTARVLVKTAVQ